MNNLTIRAKLILLSLIPLFALIYFSSTQAISGYKFKQDLKYTQNLVEYTKKISLLIHETQKERGASAGFVGSKGAKFVNILPNQRKLTDKRRREFESFVNEFDFSKNSNLKKYTNKIQEYLSQLDSKRGSVSNLSISLKDTVSYYTTMNASMLKAISEVAKEAPRAKVTKMLIAYVNFLKSKERAGIERAVLSGVFAKDSFPDGFYKKFVTLVAKQDAYMDSFLSTAQPSMVKLYNKKMKDPSVAEVQRMRGIAYVKYKTGKFGVDSVHWFKTITQKINKLKEVDDAIAKSITQEITKLESSAYTSAFGGLLSIILMSIFTGIILKDINKRIVSLRDDIEEIANKKDFSKKISTDSSDEFGAIQKSLEHLIISVKEAISTAKGSATRNESISNDLKRVISEVSSNIKKEAEIVEVVSSSSQALENTLLSTKDEAIATKEKTLNTQQKIEEAREFILNFVANIQENAQTEQELAAKLNQLSSDAEQVKGVLSIIGDIADQTNLLALNAAIEAARAGEHGRGFAVVADEVRQLAEKTQKSLQEINASISVIVQSIMDASGTMNENIQNVENLLSSTERIEQDMEEIGANMDEVATTIEETNKTIIGSAASMNTFQKHMNEIISMSGKNDERVHEVEKTTRQISESSKELMESLEHFKT